MIESELKELHDRLRSRRRRSRQTASSELASLEAVDLASLAGLERDARAVPGPSSLLLKWGAGLLLASLILFIVAKPTEMPLFGMLGGLLGALAYVLGVTGTLRFLSTGPFRPARLAISDAIAKSEDRKSAAAALELLSMGQIRQNFTKRSRTAESQLRTALVRLLPGIRPEDTVEWTRVQRNGLLIPLAEPTFDPEFSICCLRVLGLAGTSEAIPIVDRLTRLRRGARCDAIRAAAVAALPWLKERVDREIGPELLLRAAAETHGEALLRPAAGQEQGRLLRAGANCATLNEEELVRATVAREE